MQNEIDYIERCLKWIEDIKPSQANPATWFQLKSSFVPRVRAFIRKEEPSAFDIAQDLFKNEENKNIR